MIHVYLHDTQNRLLLLASHPGSDAAAQHAAEAMATGWLEHNEPDTEASVITAIVVDRIEVADFTMRGPTPA